MSASGPPEQALMTEVAQIDIAPPANATVFQHVPSLLQGALQEILGRRPDLDVETIGEQGERPTFRLTVRGLRDGEVTSVVQGFRQKEYNVVGARNVQPTETLS